jgi:hypothetical protein
MLGLKKISDLSLKNSLVPYRYRCILFSWIRVQNVPDPPILVHFLFYFFLLVHFFSDWCRVPILPFGLAYLNIARRLRYC